MSLKKDSVLSVKPVSLLKSSVSVDSFLKKANVFAVVGVSTNTSKYGYKVYMDLKKSGYSVFPVNPKHDFIGDDMCYSSLSELPLKPDVVVFVVPPSVVLSLLPECLSLKIDKVWLQPGAESQAVIDYCKSNSIACLHDQCIMLSHK